MMYYMLQTADGWSTGKLDFNSTGFSALPGGYKANSFTDRGSSAAFWTATESGMYAAFAGFVNWSSLRYQTLSKSYALSVRCVLD